MPAASNSRGRRIGLAPSRMHEIRCSLDVAWRFTAAECSLNPERSTKSTPSQGCCTGEEIRASWPRKPKTAGPSVSAQEALEFHAMGRPGKLEIVATKPMATQRDLSLAYSPGVAVPVLAIAEDPSRAFDYTTRGNMVAVISNGTAILGLGNLGALASKPVMEGKAVLFKRFADVDSIDLEVDTEDADEFINCVRFLGPSFGGINLEDIKAPECFIIEQRLRELMDIPVFHDDQHGTAIISAAGLINALEITGRDMKTTKLVCNGAGAAGIACIELIKAMGFAPENVILCDTKGVVYQGRTEGMNQWKSAHAVKTDARTLAEAHGRRRRRPRPVGQGRADHRHDPVDGQEPDHLRHGQSRPGDHAGGSGRDPHRRHHGHRPLGLSEPGQQRARLPLHLPRRAGCPRHHHQRRHEDRRGRGAGRAGAPGRARRRRRRLSGQPAEIRPQLHHPGAVRPAPDLGHPDRGGQGRDGIRRRPQADPRPRPLRAGAVRPPRPDRLDLAAHLRPRAPPAQAHRLRRGRGGAGDARRRLLCEPEARHRDPASAATRSSRRTPGTPASTSTSRASRSSMPGCRAATASMPTISTSACSARASCSATASA